MPYNFAPIPHNFRRWALCTLSAVASCFGLSAHAQTATQWEGETKCAALFDTPPPVLPGGSYLTAIKGERSVQGHYLMQSGGKLRLTFREVGKVPIFGDTYDLAYADLKKRKPLQDSLSRKTDNHIVLADVKSLRGTGFKIGVSEDESRYFVKPGSLTFTVSSKIRVADWRGYEAADAASQAAWDRHQCRSYHHELGHILVTAQVLEDSRDELERLSAQSAEALKGKQDDLLKTMGERIKARQAAYHEFLETSPGGKLSRPYMELALPWLLQNGTQTQTEGIIEP